MDIYVLSAKSPRALQQVFCNPEGSYVLIQNKLALNPLLISTYTHRILHFQVEWGGAGGQSAKMLYQLRAHGLLDGNRI